MSDEPIPLCQVLAEEYESLHGAPAERADSLSSVLKSIHQKNHAALCLSGGGIRSATFALGVIQGLARHNLLNKFHYLSTVSGGGFIGSWLSAWIHQQQGKLNKVAEESGCSQNATAEGRSVLEPEPKPIEHLRRFSNYLSPKLGFLSADAWTLTTIVVRNLLLNWMVFIPLLAAALMLPRILVALIDYRFRDAVIGLPIFLSFWNRMAFMLAIQLFSFVMAGAAFAYIGRNLPTARPDGRESRTQRDFWIRCLIPYGISSSLLALYWGWFRQWQMPVLSIPFPQWGNLMSFAVLTTLVNLVGFSFYASTRKKKRKTAVLFVGFVLILMGAVSGLIGCTIMNEFAEVLNNPNFGKAGYVCFAGLQFLILFGLSGTLIVGATSRYSDDEDREWWARAGAWFLIVVVVWSIVSVLVLFVPCEIIDWSKLRSRIISVVGALSAAASVLGGFSSTSQSGDQKKESLLDKVLSKLAAPLALAFIIVLVSLGTDLLLVKIGSVSALKSAGIGLLDSTDTSSSSSSDIHSIALNDASLGLVLIVFFALAAFGVLAAILIKVDKFSLHALYRNRLIRAYLGASRKDLKEDSVNGRNPNLFTGFDPKDNIRLHELWARAGSAARDDKDKKILHLINICLNLVGGENLAWQERKAETFTATPLHCGSFRIGYRRSQDYGGDQGLSLGTAVTISGAAASPNMGYHSSAAVTFLMSIFNARLGWRLGNPGKIRSRFYDFCVSRLRMRPTYKLSCPRFSIRPLIEESLGQTNDSNPYIYLSDGGHFENLGLYEMVLRRCKLIVLSDASCDPNYAFEDLGNAIRKIRIDFGIPIEFEELDVRSGAEAKRYAIGKIKYSLIDGEDVEDGVLIYLKPAIHGDEPADVRNYAKKRKSFPHESTADQWFSESQFESYRALGLHIANKIFAAENTEITERIKKIISL